MDIKVRSRRVNLVYGGYSRPEGVYHSSICHSFLWLWGVLINWLVGLSCIYWERAKKAIIGEQIWIWANYGGWRGLSASLINWGSGSNWRRWLPTKPAAENLSMHCNATHHIWNRGGDRGGCIFTFHSCVFVIFDYLWTCGGRNHECSVCNTTYHIVNRGGLVESVLQCAGRHFRWRRGLLTR